MGNGSPFSNKSLIAFFLETTFFSKTFTTGTCMGGGPIMKPMSGKMLCLIFNVDLKLLAHVDSYGVRNFHKFCVDNLFTSLIQVIFLFLLDFFVVDDLSF